MTKIDVIKIFNAAWNVNSGDNGVEIIVQYALDAQNEHMVDVAVFSPKDFACGVERKIIESFATYKQECTVESILERINSYDKVGEQDDAV